MGVSVTLLEAGPHLGPAKDFKEHMWPYTVGHRAVGEAAELYFGRQKSYSWFDAPSGPWEIDGRPYITGTDTKLRWFRSRILGGRTNRCGRISLRFADYYFEPYYDQAERLVGITGTEEGLGTAPEGIFMKPPAHEVLVEARLRRDGDPLHTYAAGHHHPGPYQTRRLSLRTG
jgi:choline dehydrogenase-like flavoprotein